MPKPNHFCPNRNWSILTSYTTFYHYFLKFYKFTVEEKVEFECAASWCTCSVSLGKDTCVPSTPACLSAAATALLVNARTHGADLCACCFTWCVCVGGGGGLFVIDLIMENSPWRCSQKVQRDCGIFMKNIPVVPASVTRRLWIKPGYGRLPRGRKEGRVRDFLEDGKQGMEGDWL